MTPIPEVKSVIFMSIRINWCHFRAVAFFFNGRRSWKWDDSMNRAIVLNFSILHCSWLELSAISCEKELTVIVAQSRYTGRSVSFHPIMHYQCCTGEFNLCRCFVFLSLRRTLYVLTFTDNLKFAKRHLPNPPAVDVLSDTVVIVAHNNPCRDSFSSLAECKREHRKRLSATVWRLHNKTRQECLSSR